MAAMISQRLDMDTLLSTLSRIYPQLTFREGSHFYWSPGEQVVYYAEIGGESDAWTLLHETSHGLLQHTNYHSDFELLQLELAAWEKAKELGNTHGLRISCDHIEDCLDTYRDWLHKRSLCPTCGVKSLQRDKRSYGCMNCGTTWQVSKNRLCRTYRKKQPVT